jgi:hypothetical protein
MAEALVQGLETSDFDARIVYRKTYPVCLESVVEGAGVFDMVMC